MWMLNLARLALKQLRRQPVRTLLTVLGVTTGMFLFACVESMQQSMRRATEVTAADNLLIVFRENRFCPFTSRLPESYGRRIADIDGVADVTPIQVVVNNCGTSLDVVTFRGVPVDSVDQLADEFSLLSGSLDRWKTRSDAALVGEALAKRRNLAVGDSFNAAGITVSVAGIISGENPQMNNAAYVQLAFLQQASGVGLGSVTQFNVRLKAGAQMDQVAAAVDQLFATDQEPTATRPEKAFVAQTAGHMLKLIAFTRLVGWGAVLAVAGLVSNTILLTVRGRIKENAILQTVGFGDSRIAYLVLTEGVLLGLLGGILGIAGAAMLFNYGGLALSGEGLSIVFSLGPGVVWSGLGLSLLIGLGAGIIPAWLATRHQIVNALRMEG